MARRVESLWVERLVVAGQLTAPILAAALAVATAGWALHEAASSLADLVGADLEGWSAPLRLTLFGGCELAAVLALARPVRKLAARLPRRKRRARAKPSREVQRAIRFAWAAAGGPSALATAVLLVGLGVQPTLVGFSIGWGSWVERAANVVDGSAAAELVDAVVWLARWIHPKPVVGSDPVAPDAFDLDLDADSIPLIDRWDAQLLDAAGGDRELFAKTKAVMWVESGGRQFALSSTGCAGLMQFCASTTQDRPLHAIFGTGQVAACGCDDCRVPRELLVALETDPDAAEHPAGFPCEITDARFDPDKSIRAGVAFVRELDQQLGGNLPLVYVAYNAGPSIARSLYQSLGRRPDLSIDDLRPRLADALRPTYGSRAGPRAQGLLDVHLPKLMRAYQKWKGP